MQVRTFFCITLTFSQELRAQAARKIIGNGQQGFFAVCGNWTLSLW